MIANKKTAETNGVSLIRLYLLRALYLLVIVGLGIVQWPVVIDHIVHQEKSWELMEGVVACMLTSFSVLSILGLRYPLRMLPLLFWELGWKSIWLLVVAFPQWTTGTMNDSTWETASACLLVVIFPFFIPWRYVFANYVKKRGDRWR
ncbi:hypothetical protein AB4Z29_21815 [Paenibacillus sp. 2TAB23]|uniref:hypothetical protein n=1 Tax=Paenibacillus sp. 2TAB23 TaxID=3233004 RepID=UPI003F97BBCC